MKKKRSEMTPMERMEYIMKDSNWEDAEEVKHGYKQYLSRKFNFLCLS